jgi:hypothetical protein
LKLFLALIDVACVNTVLLWMLKYTYWQQKEIIQDLCICFLLEMKWQDHTKEEGLIVETSADVLARP